MTSTEALGPHPDEELLAALAMGDPDDLTDAQRAHASTCPECSRSVASLRRTAQVVRTAQRPAREPDARVWRGVLREVRSGAAVETSRRRYGPWIAAAVLAALVAGAVGGAQWARRDPGPSSPPKARDVLLAQAELEALGGSSASGQAEVVRRGEQVELRVWGSHLGAGDHEVWLLNRDGKRLVALGLLGRGEAGTFTMPGRLLQEGYVDVDVSLEPDDGNPAHSGDSLARGRLRDV